MGVPTRLGRYVVRRRLGSGGFATVWLGYDEQLDAEVAVKVLAENWAHDDSVRRRFLEEGRFLRRVESEHVVQVHDVGELEDGRPFLVLTYADRGTLADRLKKEPLDLSTAIGVVVQVGRGLQALHRRGLLHRDVKPANVLFRGTDEGERAVLSDLGLGKSLDEVSRITMPGGTPSYVAPEQAMGERLDQRADQYSLGAVAYAALTGRSPHQVDGLGAAGRVKAPEPPSALGFAVPDKVDAAIVRALDPNRENRWPDVAAFTRELVGALDETTHDFVPGAALATIVVPAEPKDAGGKDPGVTTLSDANAPTVFKPSVEKSVTVEWWDPADTAGAGPASHRTLSPIKPEPDPGEATPAQAAPSTPPAAGTGTAQPGSAQTGVAPGASQPGGAAGAAPVDPAADTARIGATSGTAHSSTTTKGGAAPGTAHGGAASGSPQGGAASGGAQAGSGPFAAQAGAARVSVGGPDAETAVVERAPEKVGRRKGRWIAAAVVVFLVGGGAGFAAQRYFEDRALPGLRACAVVKPSGVGVSEISAECRGGSTLPQHERT
ncbi:serine/threonine protein kinase [Kribbella amoyensis]|uniref:non-specific serine/threonine protein kinase n=1 Tax=Kribbella amoyensis TaxID=996641 RepID=A0A561BMS1_9ACTN|nr:serine/threonine-protein kinase [Kribbella amoyensis]TWD80092.1 serine/threonine protein kinase [Kribbella amoyensis]